MSLTIKLIVSLVIGAAVATAATLLQGKPMPDLPMILACCIAAFSSVIAVSLMAPGKSRAGDASSGIRAPAAAETRTQASDTDAGREFGKVKWFNASKGFGFIIKDDGDEIFVHFRSIRGEGRRGLRDGQRVSFVVVDSEKGPQAEDVAAED
jgi:CspA family cold shock protein